MRHRLHAICPYFAMFPEDFVAKNLAWTEPGDLVFDPFCGRGTTVLESLLQDRNAIGSDINNVAVCVSRAKAAPPSGKRLRERIRTLEEMDLPPPVVEANEVFFSHCFDRQTLRQLLLLRRQLDWRNDDVDCFLAAVALGCLHGESHRSPRYFSNRMPRTISTKPKYSVAWWQARDLRPPRRDVFQILRHQVEYRQESPPPERTGHVHHADVRKAAATFAEFEGRVSLVITSPPYIDTTDFAEDQWLRLWLLGGPEFPRRRLGDDRHHNGESYWQFLEEAWTGVGPLLSDGANVVVRLGGKKLDRGTCAERLRRSLAVGTGRKVELRSQYESSIRRGQLKSFRPNARGTVSEIDIHLSVA